MKLLHLSSRGNRESILEHGLLPSKISLEPHLNAFQGSGLVGDKCVYTWNSDVGQSTDKYIRDMIYCILFIHPRNKMGNEFYENIEETTGVKSYDTEEKDRLDYSQFGTQLYGKTDTYDLFEIDIDEKDPLLLQNHWIHGQMSNESKFDSCHMLNDKYAHEDKELRISGSTIPPNMLKLVSSIKSRIYKNDTIGVSYVKK